MNIDGHLRCPNCKAALPFDGAKVYASVVVCESCYKMAVHFDNKITKEFAQLQLLLRDKVREMLTTGNFHFGETQQPVLNKVDLIQELTKKGNVDVVS